MPIANLPVGRQVGVYLQFQMPFGTSGTAAVGTPAPAGHLL